MRKRPAVILSVATALLLAVPLGAQQFEQVPAAKPAQQTAAPTDGTKVGVINVQIAMAQTQEGKKASEELQARFAPKQAQVQTLQDEIRDLRNKLDTQGRTLSDEARAQLFRDAEQKQKQLTRAQQDLQDDAEAAQGEYINAIGQKMQRIIDRYARENSLSLILNASPGSPIVYIAPTVDITQDIIQLYDQTYPVQAAGQAAPPAARSNRPPNQ